MTIPNDCMGIVDGDAVLADDAANGFYAFDPATTRALPERFVDADRHHIDRACDLAAQARRPFADASGDLRGRLLRTIADRMRDARQSIVDRCQAETGYLLPRVEGEFARAVHQLDLFATLAETSRWDDVVTVPADPDRKPLPRPKMRRRLVPVGPVAVFGACNFPLAISVAGNDLVAAYAAGSPVVVKSHPSHPGTCHLVGQAVADAVAACGLPAGVFSLLHGHSKRVSEDLVRHRSIAAVGFTGSPGGGRAIAACALGRERPIPVYAELGSTNPVFLTDAAIAQHGESIAKGFVESLRFGNGHMCTKPGVVVLTRSAMEIWRDLVVQPLAASEPLPMLSESICRAFDQSRDRLIANEAVQTLFAAERPTEANRSWHRGPVWLSAPATNAIAGDLLHQETFGPLSIAVVCDETDQWLDLSTRFSGSLTTTLHHGEDDGSIIAAWRRNAEDFAGRIIASGWPTGMEIGPATQHGGPYPASLDGRSTSVGFSSIDRFVRPVCYQNEFPDDA
ncbi:MAG: aldehyde dehydrogenase (NADP(+)) [Planctomycetota bacterium]